MQGPATGPNVGTQQNESEDEEEEESEYNTDDPDCIVVRMK